jgi:hypothetical protein
VPASSSRFAVSQVPELQDLVGDRHPQQPDRQRRAALGTVGEEQVDEHVGVARIGVLRDRAEEEFELGLVHRRQRRSAARSPGRRLRS